jgi:hypothetical protein
MTFDLDRFDAAMIAEYLLALEDAAEQAGKPEAICGRLINRGYAREEIDLALHHLGKMCGRDLGVQ